MEINNFYFSQMPKIYFGEGEFKNIFEKIQGYGKNVLLVLGGSSFKKSKDYAWFKSECGEKDIKIHEVSVKGEPSPEIIDANVELNRDKGIDVVVAIGGGSVLDAGKAISAMLTKKESVVDYLEGVGTGAVHNGEKLPFIAVPTTSGTGSEATKNAVISKVGENGFKKSLRHDNFVPNIAIVDPELTMSCPASITASCGLDAFTQLLEAYVSTKSSPITDSLSLSGLKAIKDGLMQSFENGDDIEARKNLAYASFMSGAVLANSGLGVVHGYASPIGAYFDIPHGIVCGTLVGEATKINIRELKKDVDKGKKYLKKYAIVGRVLSGKYNLDDSSAYDILVKIIETWIVEMGIDKLSKYGIKEPDLLKIVGETGIKNNPVKLDKEPLLEILKNRL